MDPEEHYYKLNRFFLSISGLNPYQSKWNARLIRAVFTVIMLSSIFFQVFDVSENNVLFNIDILRTGVRYFLNLEITQDIIEYKWNVNQKSSIIVLSKL